MTEAAEKRGEPTLGPYHIEGHDEGPGQRYLHIYSDRSIQVLASMNPSHPDTIANAELFAAAPDTAAERDRLKAANAELLTALEILSDQWCHGNCYINDNGDGDHEDECKAATAAIAKAKEPTP